MTHNIVFQISIFLLIFGGATVKCQDTLDLTHSTETPIGGPALDFTTESPQPSPEPEDPLIQLNTKSAKSRILKKLLVDTPYDKYVRPMGANGTGPVVVKISMLLRNVENIDDVQMGYTAQLTFREQWVDPRLEYGKGYNVDYIQLSTAQSIWVPDVFFSNEQTGSIMHELMTPNFFGRIFPDGSVLISYRITLQLSCPMNLRYFPMDKQNCYLKMASYGWTTTDVVLIWPESNASMQVSVFTMPKFKLIEYERELCQSVTLTGTYSCIQLRLRFERQFGYYLIQIYAPCVMLVFVSWIAFWLEPTATEARVCLAITAILAVVTQTDGINSNVPPASYIKAVDVWTFAIQFMVFAAVLQFSYVNYLAKYHWKRMAKRLNIVDEDDWTKTGCELRRQTEKGAKRVDTYSKIGFPLVFALFNVFYWSYYLGTVAKEN